MVQLILETDDLVLQLDDLSLALNELGLLALKVEGLAIDKFVEVIDPCQLLRDVVLKGSSLSSQVVGFFALQLILIVQLINFFGILAVSFSQVHQLSLQMLLLGLELGI